MQGKRLRFGMLTVLTKNVRSTKVFMVGGWKTTFGGRRPSVAECEKEVDQKRNEIKD